MAVSRLVLSLYYTYLAGRVNWGCGRSVSTKHGVKVHRSVQIRLKALYLEDGKYQTNAKVDLLQLNPDSWVD
jgi:hypothetical protein